MPSPAMIGLAAALEVEGDETNEPAPGPEIGALGRRRDELLLAGSVTLIAFVAYAQHLLPGVGFWDTGIFQSAAPTLGLTHPTGYPLYMILGWIAVTVVPVGDAAFRMNLLGAVAAAVGVGALYLLIRWIGATAVPAAIGALTFGLSQVFWRTAVRADPHPLHVLLAIIVILMALEWRRGGYNGRWLAATAFVCGLALGNHLLMAILAPALGLYVLACQPRILAQIRRMVGPAVALAVGAAVYLYVPIRAATNPPIHHDYMPTTWDAFWRYVLGRDFGGSMGFLSLDGPGRALDKIPEFVASLATGTHPAIAGGLLLLAGIGFIGLLRTDWRTGLLLGLGGGLTLYAALTYANGDIERYYFVPLAILVAFAALGTQLLLWAAIPALPSLQPATPMLLIIPVALIAVNGGRVDGRSAQCYADGVMGTVKPNAVVMSWWTYTTPLWYERFVGGVRPDVEIYNGIDLVPDEVDRRYGQGRPIYLIQPDSTLTAIRKSYSVTPLDACGVAVFEVTGRAGARTASSRSSPWARR